MDIDRARTFLEIIRTGSFVRAAERLNVTQTTVSARIKALEEELGRQLFVRNKSGAHLTAAGDDFQNYALTLVQVWERARHQIALPPGHRGIVAIGGELSLWNPLLIDWLVWMRQAHKDIAVRAKVALPEQLMDFIRSGILDLAIVYSPRLEQGFQIELLLEETLVLVRNSLAPDDGATPDEFIYVDWGPQFAAQQRAGLHMAYEPGLFIDLGPLALNYLLRAGGRGYFRRGAVTPYLATGQLQLVRDAPEIVYPAYVLYSETADRAVIEPALAGLHKVVKTIGCV